VPEGDGNLLDNTCVLYAHEHAEANPHKNSGLAMILAGHAGGMKTACTRGCATPTATCT
jgi:4-hydroxy-3-methylbut-2-enyl diphosphate reductase IspH